MHTNFLDEIFTKAADHTAILWNGTPYKYSWLQENIRVFQNELVHRDIQS